MEPRAEVNNSTPAMSDIATLEEHWDVDIDQLSNNTSGMGDIVDVENSKRRWNSFRTPM